MDDSVELKIVQAYTNGARIADIKKEYHLSYYDVVRVLDKYDIPHNPKTKKERKKEIFLSRKEELIKDYTEGMSLNECVKKYGVYLREIKQVLNDNNIHIRSFQEASRKIDEDFFVKQNHDMAWLLGFIAADGNISEKSNAITIKLSIKDEEILHKIRALIGINNNITYYTTKDGFDVCSYRWSCKKHKEDLAIYDIVPNKTFLLKPPYKLSEEFHLDYIRGYFDGDGSINLIKSGNGRGNGSLRWQVCSATKEIIEFILNTFEKYGIPKVSIQVRKGRNPLYIISFSSVSTRKIYDILYNESEMYLERKRNHYEEILDLVPPLQKI